MNTLLMMVVVVVVVWRGWIPWQCCDVFSHWARVITPPPCTPRPSAYHTSPRPVRHCVGVSPARPGSHTAVCRTHTRSVQTDTAPSSQSTRISFSCLSSPASRIQWRHLHLGIMAGAHDLLQRGLGSSYLQHPYYNPAVTPADRSLSAYYGEYPCLYPRGVHPLPLPDPRIGRDRVSPRYGYLATPGYGSRIMFTPDGLLRYPHRLSRYHPYYALRYVTLCITV